MKRAIRIIAPLLLVLLAPLHMGQWAVVLSGSVPAGGYSPSATHFAGDTQCWMERDGGLTGATDTGVKFIFSVWVNFTGGDGVEQSIFRSSSGTRFQVSKRTTNLIRIVAKSADNVVRVQLDQNAGAVAAITAATGWVNILCTGDNTLTTGFATMYINGVSCGTVTTLGTAGVPDGTALDFVEADWATGATVGGTLYITGDLSEFYFNGAESIDLTNATNREKWRSSGGDPVDLGSDGSTPTGTAPLVYFRSVYTSFTTNSATGGNFVKYGTTAFTSATPP